MATFNAKQQLADRLAAEGQALALQGFFRIMVLWNAGTEEARRILGSPPLRTFYAWKKQAPAKLPEDTLRRIGYVAGIWKALQIVYSDSRLADGWVARENEFFGGQTPLQRMAAGDVTDLAAVRAYIDAARAPWS
ncbi:MAG TPA: MbcA/ParS/Xre antitoxin family protein [Pseudolabrys sp.]|nr:MbcA/ParS/Xre antitoxin family protein [Pseudolabrys sp.]